MAKISRLNSGPAWTALVVATACSIVLSAGGQPPTRPLVVTDGQTPVFRSGVTLVTTDVIVRDGDGQFVPDLLQEDFAVYEDGELQEIASVVLVLGGRVYNQLLPPPPVQEGIVLPSSQPVSATPGRIFVLFIDDLHITPETTPKMRSVFKMLTDTLIHEGDMFGIISSGKSGLSVQMTLDRSRLDEAMNKILGEAMEINDMVRVNQANSSMQEIRWRAHSAFKTALQTVRNLERVQNRRKVFIYLSAGYHFDPFGDSRTLARYRSMIQSGLYDPDDPLEDAPTLPEFNDPALDQIDQSTNLGSVFSDAELQLELLQLTNAANRANVSFYTVDPRGLLNTMDLDTNPIVRQTEYNEHTAAQRNSLRMLAELTGGMAVVNRNTFENAFREIDNETSSYYVLGFYSSNPDPTHRTRHLRVDVNRDGADVRSRTYYSIPAATQASRP